VNSNRVCVSLCLLADMLRVLISTSRTGALALRVAAAAAATLLLRLVCLDALELFQQAHCFFLLPRGAR
jgi:hypothetical protein